MAYRTYLGPDLPGPAVTVTPVPAGAKAVCGVCDRRTAAAGAGWLVMACPVNTYTLCPECTPAPPGPSSKGQRKRRS